MTRVTTALGCGLALLLAASMPAQTNLFTVTEQGDLQAVSANRNGVPADQALRDLAAAMGWSIEFETERLRGLMSVNSIDVALENQGPRTVAHLLAVAGGGDVVFNDRTVLGKPMTSLIIVSPPSADTESGRQRLREWAIRWYGTFLQDDLRYDPLVEEHSMDVRMNMARMYMEQGALEEAALIYADVQTENPSHEYVPMALLRLAECRFELGEEHWPAAERACRDLMQRHPSLKPSSAGVVLLGKILNAQKRYAECIKTLTASYLRLSGTPEILDLYMLVGRAEYGLRNPENVLRTMNIVDGAHGYKELSREQWLDYLFLRGYGLLETGQHEEAMEALEIFLGTGPQDSRRGVAFILLGRTYLALERFVEARSAAIEAHNYKVGGQMDAVWSREASKFYAKTALEIGDKDEAFDKLEVEVRKGPESEPELVVYLVEAFMGERRYQKAIITSDLISELDTDLGDKARFLRIQAMWEQSLAAGGATLRSFPNRAIHYAHGVKSKERLRKVAEIFGRAYELNGEIEKAADAYRGLLRWN